jgi:hypothetical protein
MLKPSIKACEIRAKAGIAGSYPTQVTAVYILPFDVGVLQDKTRAQILGNDSLNSVN